MKFIDLFAGIGGFRYGLERTNQEQKPNEKGLSSVRSISDSKRSIRNKRKQNTYTCVWSNEWDKYASQIYKKHYGECDTKDIRTVKASEIPDHDLLTAGFPCQAFSVAGKRLGFEDTRGTLFFEIARILKHKRPKLVLLENVKGLLSHEQGKTFQTIIGVLSDIGYRVEWQVLNSKNFGVPQNRERVFIVGHLRGESRPKVFPIRKTSESDGKMELRHNATRQVSPAIRTPSGGYHTPTIRYPLKFMKRNQKRIEGSHSFAVDGANTGGVKQGMKIRRLTPTECERLQGFPDGWTEGISDTQRYKCLGNAVTTNVIQAIGERFLK